MEKISIQSWKHSESQKKMLQVQPLCDVEQRLEHFEVGVLVRNQILTEKFAKMNGCFHRC